MHGIFAQCFEQGVVIGGNGVPLRYRLRRYLDVKLGGDRVVSHTQRLDRAQPGRREDLQTVGDRLHRRAVPLQAGQRCGEAAEESTGHPRGRQANVHHPHLRPLVRTDVAAQCRGQQLMSQTDAHKGHLFLHHSVPNGGFFFHQPRVRLLLPHVHRAAHRPQRVIGVQVRNALSRIQFNNVPPDPVLGEEFPEQAGMFHVQMLEDQQSLRAHNRLPGFPSGFRTAVSIS